MTDKKLQVGESGAAPFATPAKNTGTAISNEMVVALHTQIKQLTIDLEAIERGASGSTFAKGEKAKLEARIATLERTLAEVDPGISRGE